VRGLLEDLGSDLGLTDPISGESLVKFGPPRKTAKKRTAKPGAAKKRAVKRTNRKPAARKSAPKKRKR